MVYQRLSSLAQLLFLSCLATACSNGSPIGSAVSSISSVKLFGDSGESASEAPIPFHGKDHSCAVSAQVGGAAPLVLNPTGLSQLLFRKSIDYGKISALFQASGNETVRAIQTANVALYKGDGVPLGQCPQYSYLNSAPGDLQGYWIGLARSVAFSEGGGRLLGLYIAQGDQLGSVKPKGALIVTADTTKWTLIHEFMHHEFDVALRGSGQYTHPEQLRAAAEPALQYFMAAFKTVPENQGPDASSANLWRDHLYRLGATLPQIFLQFYMEEIAIEHTLSSAYSSGQLAYVPDLRQDARGYMSFAVNRLDQLTQLFVRALRSYSQSAGANEHMPALSNSAHELLRLRDEAYSVMSGSRGLGFRIANAATDLVMPSESEDSNHDAHEHGHLHNGLDPKIESGLDDLF